MQSLKTSLNQRPNTVLLVDDDPGDRRLFRYVFSEHMDNAELHDLPSGTELLDWLEQRQSDIRGIVILLDLNMPGMEGFEVLDRLRQNPVLRVIPVLIYSTSDAERDIVKAYAKGANAYIKKPHSLEELTKYIQHIKGFWFSVAKTALPNPSVH